MFFLFLCGLGGKKSIWWGFLLSRCGVFFDIKSLKMPKKLGFVPYSVRKNIKNGGIPRVCGCFEVCGAVKWSVFVVGDC